MKPWSTLIKHEHPQGLVRIEKYSKKDIHKKAKYRHRLLSQWKSLIRFRRIVVVGLAGRINSGPLSGRGRDVISFIGWDEREISQPFIDADHKAIF
jgi:hypothetical protein